MNLGVCMVAIEFYPLVGGMQTHTLALAQRLRALGVDVFIITRRYQKMSPYEKVNGLPIYRVDIQPGASKVKVAIQFIGGAIRLMKQLQDRFQIIHSHQVISPATIGLIGRELMGKKLIINPHSAKQGGGLATLLRRRPFTGQLRLFWMRKRADAYIAISQEVKDDLIDLGFPHSKIAYIPNGVDTARFSPLSASNKIVRRHELNLSDGPILTYAGRLATVKQLDVLLHAFAGLVPKLPAGAQLLIIGDGEERERLQDSVIKLEISQQVKFVGFVSNVETYLQASDIFILPSRSEGLPVALLEAMACGLPCVASAIGGVLDIIQPGTNGLVIPSGDAYALQNAIETLSTDSLLATQLAQQARLDICRDYSLDRTVQNSLQLYRRLLCAEV